MNIFNTAKKGFVILTIVFLTRIATVDMVLWDDTRIVPSDSQLWAIQCTWSSYRNNQICYKGREVYLDVRQVLYATKGHCSLTKDVEKDCKMTIQPGISSTMWT